MSSQPDLVKFGDLSRTPPEVMASIEAAIARVLASGWFVMGPEHDAFEAELATYVGARHVVGLGNGTDALELALAAVGVTAGDTVVTVANAGAYSTIALRLLGAHPAFADVDPATLLMTPATFQTALDSLASAPRAVVVTHLYGAMADVEGIVEISRRHGIAVVEDCAQSLGASRNGTMSGMVGDIATTSFYPTKNLGALGDGGAVFTNSEELATAVRRTRQYGWSSKYHIGYDHGRNSRLDELQAAILRVKLPLLDGWNARRREIHARYEAATSRMVNRASESFIGHLAVATSDDRGATRAALRAAGVATDVHYPVPDHHQEFPSDRPTPVSLPATEAASASVFSVPLFPELTDVEVDRVSAALASVVGS
ncbi:MAG: DegT/DnrJ/EryC1/StrS family aminotransferase [Actinobacteria bacterium]|nr:DegT/DnrJ/EryC1/StrS family aminotransferase [Actinomycetota bacterium]